MILYKLPSGRVVENPNYNVNPEVALRQAAYDRSVANNESDINAELSNDPFASYSLFDTPEARAATVNNSGNKRVLAPKKSKSYNKGIKNYLIGLIRDMVLSTMT